MSWIQGVNNVSFNYPDYDADPSGNTMANAPDGYAEVVNHQGGPSFGGGILTGIIYFWKSLTLRQADPYINNKVQIDDGSDSINVMYVHGHDAYDDFAAALAARFPSGTPTDPYP